MQCEKEVIKLLYMCFKVKIKINPSRMSLTALFQIELNYQLPYQKYAQIE